MRYNKNKLINHIKSFYTNTKYLPTSYDYIFHKKYFPSPVTVRKHFGSWENYIDEFVGETGLALTGKYKMWYGGYGYLYSIEPLDLPNDIYFWEGIQFDEPLSERELAVANHRAKHLQDVLEPIATSNFEISPDRKLVKKYLFPYFVINDYVAVCSFDTPYYKKYYNRVKEMKEILAERYKGRLINLNNVKGNHLIGAVTRGIDLI